MLLGRLRLRGWSCRGRPRPRGSRRRRGRRLPREYSPEDRAQAFVVLNANDGNLKRTARDTGIPEPTLRRWRKQWDESGPPAIELVEEVVINYVDEMEKTRDLSLTRIRERLESENVKDQGTLPQLATVFGILTDKIDRARGLTDKRVEHVHSLPSPDEIRSVLGALVEGVRAGHEIREEEIEDAEILDEEPRALPQSTNKP